MATSGVKLSTALLIRHPKLRQGVEGDISSPSKEYNCIAFALGFTNQRWQPIPDTGDHWPDDIAQEDTEEAWLALFEKYKFIRCNDGNFESGFEKIAIYVDDEGPAHVAKLTPSGKWRDITKSRGWLAAE